MSNFHIVTFRYFLNSTEVHTKRHYRVHIKKEDGGIWYFYCTSFDFVSNESLSNLSDFYRKKRVFAFHWYVFESNQINGDSITHIQMNDRQRTLFTASLLQILFHYHLCFVIWSFNFCTLISSGPVSCLHLSFFWNISSIQWNCNEIYSPSVFERGFWIV